MSLNTLPVKYEDIEEAADRLLGIAHRTPILTSRQVNEKVGAQVFFKCENFQRVGSFKFRGAYNAIAGLSDEQKKKGVVAFSSGNHAQAVALAGRLLKVSATIVMPHDAPEQKLTATKQYGGTVVIYERGRESREGIAARLAETEGRTIIPPFDSCDVIAGQGTSAKELFEDVGTLDYLFVPVGGGGLISGSAVSASRLSPNCHIIGVEPQAGNDVQQSFRTGKAVTIPLPQTIADGAQTTCVGALTFQIIQALVHSIETVDDDQLLKQVHFFAERMKIIVEPTGCLGAAAVSNRIVDTSGKRVGVILSGGNMDLGEFSLG